MIIKGLSAVLVFFKASRYWWNQRGWFCLRFCDSDLAANAGFFKLTSLAGLFCGFFENLDELAYITIL
jgi:hypothetical protein